MGVSFFDAENRGASIASWGCIAGPLKPLNLSLFLPLEEEKEQTPPTIRVGDSAFSCHDSRVPLKPCVRKQCEHLSHADGFVDGWVQMAMTMAQGPRSRET